ncbi:4Fe-4S dicluster domain-containing protein [Saccharicrinis sp. 156]|uniref:4Fe-4S dicluster domain-containing protein n=1 Tax=Saccharicrinis sp. 156 TaxID=3417574 RepID=UPI003D355F61
MGKRVIIDLSKFRDCRTTGECDNPQPAGVWLGFPDNTGLKTIRELAIFQFTCRKCEDAPCMTVCPTDALERNKDGIITRALNLCISCKSCVTACPFGTLMTDFFTFTTHVDDYLDLADEDDLKKFMDQCPEGAVGFTDNEASEDENIYPLNEKILIKEVPWDKLK